jgi:hypothetical protein
LCISKRCRSCLFCGLTRWPIGRSSRMYVRRDPMARGVPLSSSGQCWARVVRFSICDQPSPTSSVSTWDDFGRSLCLSVCPTPPVGRGWGGGSGWLRWAWTVDCKIGCPLKLGKSIHNLKLDHTSIHTINFQPTSVWAGKDNPGWNRLEKSRPYVSVKINKEWSGASQLLHLRGTAKWAALKS